MATKKEFRYFTIFNHQKEEEYLRSRHKEGWKFVRVSGLGVYHFESCEPADVVYQLDYNPQRDAQKLEYLKMFEDCGWSYLQDYAGYSYFCKPAADMKGEERIFNDDSSRTAMMGRVYKGRLMPLFTIFFACLVPQFILNFLGGRYFLAAFMGGLLLAYVGLFAACAISYYKMKNR